MVGTAITVSKFKQSNTQLPQCQEVDIVTCIHIYIEVNQSVTYAVASGNIKIC